MASQTLSDQCFNLRWWFAIGSFGSIAAICLLSAFWVSTFMTRSLLDRDGELSQAFLERIVGRDGPAIFKDDGSGSDSAQLRRFADEIIGIPGTQRVNVYAPSRRILWSTDKELVGRVFPDNDELGAALAGTRVVDIETFPEDKKSEHAGLGASGQLIEAYIPVYAEDHRSILGVVEFYKLPLGLDATFRNGRRILWTGTALAALTLFLTLYWIVQRGARLIERQQSDLAEMEAMAAIGQMSSAVAHSLRNPMASIRSSAELWRRRQPEEEREVVEEVIGEVDRMDGYVRDLLAYAHSEPSQMHPVDPVSVIDAILAKQQRCIERNGIKVERTEPGGAVPLVLAHQTLLEQALTSVVTNAIEVMPDGGLLKVSIDRCGRRERVRIEIADTGRGIPPELLQRVAKSYFTTKARGLGLGLVLAKGIVERFQGTFRIASTKGVGTTISVDLRCA